VRRLILAVALAVSLLTVSAGTAAASAPRLPVVHGALGWNQDLTRPSFLGAMYSRVPPKAIDANVVLETLRWSSWGQRTAHGTGRISWAQPGPGGNGISRQAPVTVTLSAVGTHGGRRYFSRLAFSFTWRGHKYAGTERFADPCGNTAGCWVTPGTPVA
jgi:hypothetical protein